MSLENELTKAFEGTIVAAKEHGYNPTFFIQMLAEYGGVETAKRLLVKTEPQTGLFELWHLGLLHESMESIVLQEKFHSLFSAAELAEAHQRLDDLGYFS